MNLSVTSSTQSLPNTAKLFVGFLLSALLVGVAGCSDDESSDRVNSSVSDSSHSDQALFAIGSDSFLAGMNLNHSVEGVDDLYMAGENLYSSSAIGGSAHLAGRRVEVLGTVAQNLYAAGADVVVGAEVGDDAKLSGYALDIRAAIGGDLMASGAKISLAAPVAGYALLAGKDLAFNGSVEGDVVLAGENISFGPQARIAGSLQLYESKLGATEVPAAVLPAERVERKALRDFDERRSSRFYSWAGGLLAFLAWLLAMVLITALVILLAPNYLSQARERTLARPGRMLLLGFASLSTLLGAMIVLALTLVGALLIPVVVLLALLLVFFGYLTAAYVLGAQLLRALRFGSPASLLQQAAAALVGNLAAAVLSLIPFVGWILLVLLALTGIGALSARWLPVRLLGAQSEAEQDS